MQLALARYPLTDTGGMRWNTRSPRTRAAILCGHRLYVNQDTRRLGLGTLRGGELGVQAIPFTRGRQTGAGRPEGLSGGAAAGDGVHGGGDEQGCDDHEDRAFDGLD